MAPHEKKQGETVIPANVIPGFLYLGSYDTASRSGLLKTMGITHILNVRAAGRQGVQGGEGKARAQGCSNLGRPFCVSADRPHMSRALQEHLHVPYSHNDPA